MTTLKPTAARMLIPALMLLILVLICSCAESALYISNDESGGEPEPLAGRNILRQMYLRDIPTKVVVVTMYENFVDGTRISKLDEMLKNEYPDNYCGFVFFSHTNFDWSQQLKLSIDKLL